MEFLRISPAPTFPMHPFSAAKQNAMRRYKKGQLIYSSGDEADRVFFIAEGKVKISAFNDENKEVTKAIFGTGEFFGETAVTGEPLRRDFATALTDVSLHSLSSRDMLMLLQAQPELTMHLMQVMAARQVLIERRLESLVFRDSRSRIVECVVDMAKQKGQPVGYEWVVRNPVTHQEIANMTATSRQTVTTTLNDLRAKKLLTFNRKRLLIRNLDGLAAEIRA